MPSFLNVIDLNERKGRGTPGDVYHPGLVNSSIFIVLWPISHNFNNSAFIFAVLGKKNCKSLWKLKLKDCQSTSLE